MYFLTEIDKYILEQASEEDEILKELNRETHIKALNARMISGHPQGKLLEIISKIVNPAQILEIGTFTGYSAICLARGLQPNGILHTIDTNDELYSISQKYFKKAGLENNVKTYHGDALEIIPKIELTFDLVFIDADKLQYKNYYELVIEKVRSGGIILADNVLWNGKVVDKNALSDPDTNAIREFNLKVKKDPRVEAIILPLRDGISFIRKL